MTGQRIILLLVLFIVLIATGAEIIFEGFSTKPIILLIATVAVIVFLWGRPEK
ncbi:hypothetical protein [Cytobacillus dafuensis]|uniref:hypothetical protein n=1 Tax=Cytobacillus dafuensis TaxID=1742359 RepID=UPI000AE49747|nr:hypothetical protein [Cytobacillus dafuensis]